MSSEAIRKQVEFYFSDSNYRRDTFLKAAAESDPDGFVAISVLLTFNRLKSLTTDVAVVADAIESSEQLILSSDRKKVKRANPLPETDESAAKSLYVKGYPTDDAEVTIDSISEQFSVYGRVLYVKMRTTKDRTSNASHFKGSVIIEFDTVESMEKALAAAVDSEGKVILGYKGKPFVVVSTFAAWLADKKAYAETQTGKKRKAATAEAVEEAAEPEPVREVSYQAGLVIALADLPTHLTAVEWKEFLRTIGDVRFVEYTNESTEAVIRCADSEASEKVLQALNVPVEVPKAEKPLQLSARLLTGEEEKAYWVKNDADFKARRDSRNKQGKGRGRGRGNQKRARN